MKKYKQGLVFSLSALSAAMMCQTTSVYASDIEIYKAPTTGGASLMLILDMSSSMVQPVKNKSGGYQNPINKDFSIDCSNNSTSTETATSGYAYIMSQTREYVDASGVKNTYTFDGRFCNVTVTKVNTWSASSASTTDKAKAKLIKESCDLVGTFYRCPDRLTILKHSISDLIIGTSMVTRLPDTASIGITTFPTYQKLDPVLLDDLGRKAVLDMIYNLGTADGTPIAEAYSVGTKNLLKYVEDNAETSCAGYGAYFLTDGEPIYENFLNAVSSTNVNKYLNSDITYTPAGRNSVASGTCTDSWNCVANVALKLKNREHTAGVEIKTAIIGFGKDFSFSKNGTAVPFLSSNLTQFTSGSNQYKAAQAAINGAGGWFSADNTTDIVNSVQNFVNSIKIPIPAITTGTATIPQDSLNAIAVQPYAYFPQFKPQPSEDFQLWSGNLKKFKVVNSILKDADNETVFKLNNNGTATTTDDYTELNVNAKDLWVRGVTDTSLQSLGGMLSKLQLKMANNKFSRKVITNSNTTLSTVDSDYILSSQKGTTSLLTNKKYLLGLLGYDFTETELLALNGNSNLTSPASSKELRNIGSVMHSIPVLLTQSGKVTYDTNVNTSDRDDYLLFGTTQGVLHVVQAGLESETTDSAYTGGKEVFAFVPQEMLNSQPRALLSEEESGENGMNSLYYGVDGPWVAHTEYVYKADEDKFVTQYNVGTVADPNWKKGKQWVYGGMRMGGRSYYALDLTDMSNPSIKFRIDPTTSKVYSSAASGGEYSYTHLAKMGQSWSKPVITNVQWKGKRRLVMFVGGGYDATGATTACSSTSQNIGYECPFYNQSNKVGAGIFMFDANTGEPLWSTYEAVDSTKPTTAPYIGDGNELKYSVVSQIKAIDREGDGDVDHLYFGDLGGQVFRIDLNSAHSTSSTSSNFSKNIVRLLDVHKANGMSPRFYETPGFSIYSGTTGNFAVVGIGSGNRSNPLLGKLVNTNYIVPGETAALNETLENDAIYNLFDTDVVQKNPTTLSLQGATASDLVAITDSNRELGTIATGATAPGNKANFTNKKGWYYAFNSSTGRKAIEKVQGDVIVIDSDLYVSTFDAESVGTTEACGAGIYGGSKAHRFCMPYGQCPNGDTVTNNTLNLGKGLLGITLGGGTNGDNTSRSIIVPLSNRDPVNNKILSSVYNSSLKLTPLSWYERN